jgi:hypothetical protein
MEKEIGYGDWVRILPLTVGMQETGDISIITRSGKISHEALAECAGKLVMLQDSSSISFGNKKTNWSVSRYEHIKLSDNVMTKVDALEAHREVEAKDIQVGDIIEGTHLSDLFYNITHSKMKRGIVWSISGNKMQVITLEHETFPDKYLAQTVLANSYGDLAAAYNLFNVIGHTELIKLKVHCDYVKPRYRGNKYACYGSLGAFLDNFNITIGELKSTLGYCPITRLFETGNIEEFEEAINSNTSLRIEIIR